MKALTIREPWATAIVYGPKRVENRSWLPPKDLIGHRIAIHAGSQFATKDRLGVPIVMNRLRSLDSVRNIAYPKAWERLMRIRDVAPKNATPELGFGCVIGVATIVEIIGGPTRAIEIGQQGWFTGPLAWRLDDVVPIEPGIPAHGRQQLWTVPAPVLAQINVRLHEQRA